MREVYYICLCCCLFVECRANFISHKEAAGKSVFSSLMRRENAIEENQRYPAALRSTVQSDDGRGKAIFLRATSLMASQNVTSGDDVQFKCKIAGWPRSNLKYTWYHNNEKIITIRLSRYTITRHDWGSKLKIKSAYTFDSGPYRCEASNGHRRVYISAHLFVSFERPPSLNLEKKEKGRIILEGSCKMYNGGVCGQILNQTEVYIDSNSNTGIEKHTLTTLDTLANSNYVSEVCRRYMFSVFCYYIFPPCHFVGKVAQPRQLCKEECELLKRDACRKEYLEQKRNQLMEFVFNNTECSVLPSVTSKDCISIGLSFKSDQNELSTTRHCYHGNGETYRGNATVTESGANCRKWPDHLVAQFPLLLAGHNHCRNPHGAEQRPWCYTEYGTHQKTLCDIERCGSRTASVLLFIMLFCACALLLLIGLCWTYLRCCRGQKKSASMTSPKSNLPQTPFVTPKIKVPVVNQSSICILSEIGVGNYGKGFIGKLAGDDRFSPEQTVALKILKGRKDSHRLDEFKRELETLSELHHSHITNLKAVVIHPGSYYLIFDYNGHMDLKQFLLKNKITSDLTEKKISKTLELPQLDNLDFTDMALQIASGMEYLESKNYIHPDLAARNILVCGNMDLKISNIGVVKDSYFSSYYKTEQGELLPIRWMAPESLQSWQFSDKSTVWSFGVLLWEMFSYGMQPYCGYSNQEVLDMISRRQLLSCPDQCPVKMSSLINFCWSLNPRHRPCFREIQTKLQMWMEVSDVIIVTREHMEREVHSSLHDFSPPPAYSSRPTSFHPVEGRHQVDTDSSCPGTSGNIARRSRKD